MGCACPFGIGGMSFWYQWIEDTRYKPVQINIFMLFLGLTFGKAML
jgi:hypothetical protein|tara:strand:+ start:1639 stop:1776 length:138 start_codon:yes stop_codon:yes gene_type:complete